MPIMTNSTTGMPYISTTIRVFRSATLTIDEAGFLYSKLSIQLATRINSVEFNYAS